MNASPTLPNRRRVLLAAALTVAAAPTSQALADTYLRHDLVSDGALPADNTDTHLVNAWGIAFSPTGPVWVADNGSGVSTLYGGSGNAFPVPRSPLAVSVPSPDDAGGGGNPTGIVFNASAGFAVTQGDASGASRFIFATEDGLIAGWAPNVDATHAITVVDNSTSTGAVYKGLALSAGGTGSRLYASDFHNARIDVFDSAFQPVTLPPGAFVDPHIPAGFAPFGLQAINGNLYVSYAKQDAEHHDDVQGRGLGFVDVYDPDGNLIQRVASRGHLNAPWGMALAPAGFGPLGNRLLVGNFGDGRINAYDLATGRFVGRLKDASHQAITIDGLWGIAFGNGFLGQPVNTLFFAAGPEDEAHGLYGRIDVEPEHRGPNHSTPGDDRSAAH
jgi:uncharacterized protein (TIGR03118 family)